MADYKSKGIPSWQRKEEASTSLPKEGDALVRPEEDVVAEPTSSRADLLEQAKKFLEHDEIRDATTEKKISFLEGKGLDSQEIQGLLGISRNEDASSKRSTTDERPSPPSVSAAHTTASQAPSTAPPVITYPEFLIHAQKPPPLITTQRVLNALYVSSATAAVLYGASTYLLGPMFETLTAARHSFFETATSNLEELNTKLESVVSSVPHAQQSQAVPQEGFEDFESEAEDPTELFHRDVGIQTSGPVSPIDSSNFDMFNEKPGSTTSHTSDLLSLRHNLQDILESGNDVLDVDENVKNIVVDLQGYLEDLMYGRRGGSFHWNSTAKAPEDEIEKVKKEIRGVKGALLSARNFPAASVGRARVGT